MKLTDEQAADMALPGDPELNFDIGGATLTAVVMEGPSLLLRLVGGYGWWATSGEDAFFRLGTDDKVTDMDLVADYGANMPQEAFGVFYRRLCRWRDDATPLRVCASPGKVMVMINNADDWLPITRTPPGYEPGEGPT